jgi:hypothetical protein
VPLWTSLTWATTGLGSQLSLATTNSGAGDGTEAKQSTMMSEGQLTITGGVVSGGLVIVWTQVDWLPHSSVAVQVRVITPLETSL